MADDFSDVFLHLVWATWDRQPSLTPEVRGVAYRHILAAARAARCPVVAIGGVEDHVHVVVRFATTVSVGELIKAMKGGSSRAVNLQCPEVQGRFKWQGTFGVFAVERASLDRIIGYVERQQEHHQNGSVDSYAETMFVPPRPGPVMNHDAKIVPQIGKPNANPD